MCNFLRLLCVNFMSMICCLLCLCLVSFLPCLPFCDLPLYVIFIYRSALRGRYLASQQLKVWVMVINLLETKYLGNSVSNFETRFFPHFLGLALSALLPTQVPWGYFFFIMAIWLIIPFNQLLPMCSSLILKLFTFLFHCSLDMDPKQLSF